MIHWADRRVPRVEIVLPLPEGIQPGKHVLEVRARKQVFPAVVLDVVSQ